MNRDSREILLLTMIVVMWLCLDAPVVLQALVFIGVATGLWLTRDSRLTSTPGAQRP